MLVQLDIGPSVSPQTQRPHIRRTTSPWTRPGHELPIVLPAFESAAGKSAATARRAARDVSARQNRAAPRQLQRKRCPRPHTSLAAAPDGGRRGGAEMEMKGLTTEPGAATQASGRRPGREACTARGMQQRAIFCTSDSALALAARCGEAYPAVAPRRDVDVERP